jgi:hypothetical protein
MNPLNIPTTQFKIVEADGIKIFYPEAGPVDGPVLLLLRIAKPFKLVRA